MDFTTALGRLLHDGGLRDAFRENSTALIDAWDLRDDERAAALALDADDLDFQAQVLIRKRFTQTANIIPRTCEELGGNAWPAFLAYARAYWPEHARKELKDAHDFCLFVKQNHPGALCMAEFNRVRFLLGARHFALHFPRHFTGRNRRRRSLQILFRTPGGTWREWIVRPGLGRRA